MTIVLSLATNVPVSLELLANNGTSVIATGVAGPRNVSLAIRNIVFAENAVNYVRISGAGVTDYSLVVLRDADFDFEGNDTLAGAEDLRTGYSEVLGAIGNGGCPDSDFYKFGANAGDNLQMETKTPSGGPGEFVNTFFPELLFYDPNGNLVAVAAGNASDGRNSVIDFTVPEEKPVCGECKSPRARTPPPPPPANTS